MTLRNTKLTNHEDAANSPHLSEFGAFADAGIPGDEFGRWLEAQSALFRGKLLSPRSQAFISAVKGDGVRAHKSAAQSGPY